MTLGATEHHQYFTQSKESHSCCCHGPLAPVVMGDSGTSTLLTRHESMRLRSLTKVREPLRGTRYDTRDELILAKEQSIRNTKKYGRADGVRHLQNIWQKMINKGATILKVHADA